MAVGAFDVRGRAIARLADGFYAEGIHAMRWSGRSADGARVTPGVYFCDLAVGDTRTVDRIVVIPEGAP